jgi:tetratricopeptide (TPR) repeat protein
MLKIFAAKAISLRGRGARCFVLLAVALAICSAGSPQSGEQSSVQRTFNESLQRGVSAAQNGNLRAAEEAFHYAVSLRPRDPFALTALGQVEEQLGKYAESVHTFREVIAIDPASPEAHVNLAITFGDQGNLAAALQEAAAAIKLNPNSSSAHFLRGRLMSDLEKRDEARSEFRKALQIEPSHAEALRHWAALEGDAGNFAAQADLLRRYLLLKPDDANACFQYGELLDDEHREPEAIAQWRRAVSLNPNYREAIYRLARAIRKSDPREAQKLIERASALERDQQTDDRIRSLGNQANAEMAESNYTGAIDDLRQAIMLCGSCSHLGALEKNLGLAYCHKGELDSCEHELKNAQALIPKDSDVAAALQVATQQRQQALRESR